MSALIWLSIGLILMALEIAIPGFVIFWFGLGGILTSFFVFTGLLQNIYLQTIFFFITSGAFVALYFFVIRKRFHKERKDERDPTLSGLKGVAIADIKPDIPGRVKLYTPYHGISEWHAVSKENIPAGAEVLIEEADGITLQIKKV